MKTVDITTPSRIEMLDITSIVKNCVAESGVKNGICVLFVPHTTCAVTINECADPDVVTDIKNHLSSLIPCLSTFRHSEGNSDAHLKSMLVGFSEHLIINDGKLVLGTWQGIYFCEFDGPRRRKLHVQIIPQ